jgi:hypothetical protein
MKTHYGMISRQTLEDVVVAVADLLPASSIDNTEGMLLFTCCVETHMGTYKDRHPLKKGIGLMQMDKIAFDDIKQRTRTHIRRHIFKSTGLIIGDIQHRDIAVNPFLSVLFARLHYMLVPEKFPDFNDDEGMARYWKIHYNTLAGRGTVDAALAKYEYHMPTYLSFLLNYEEGEDV